MQEVHSWLMVLLKSLKLANNIITSQSRTNQHYLKDVTSAKKGKPSSCDILLLLTTTTAVSTLF